MAQISKSLPTIFHSRTEVHIQIKWMILIDLELTSTQYCKYLRYVSGFHIIIEKKFQVLSEFPIQMTKLESFHFH